MSSLNLSTFPDCPAEENSFDADVLKKTTLHNIFGYPSKLIAPYTVKYHSCSSAIRVLLFVYFFIRVKFAYLCMRKTHYEHSHSTVCPYVRSLQPQNWPEPNLEGCLPKVRHSFNSFPIPFSSPVRSPVNSIAQVLTSSISALPSFFLSIKFFYASPPQKHMMHIKSLPTLWNSDSQQSYWEGADVMLS